MNKIQEDIDKHIKLLESSLHWAKEFGKEEVFPIDEFKECRRKLRRIRSALEGNCSMAAYGESQVGKSYLMSGLLSTPQSPLTIKSGNHEYNFIDDINSSGGETSKVETTGVVTRFSLASEEANKDGRFVSARLLSPTDLVLLVTDSYYNDLKLSPDSVLTPDEINGPLEEIERATIKGNSTQEDITEDDIKDMRDYVREVIGNSATSLYQSKFFAKVASLIQHITYDKWVQVFSLMWNRNEEMSRLFATLVNDYKRLSFATHVLLPFDAVLRENGTLLKVQWLDCVCGNGNMGNDVLHTDVYDAEGHPLASKFPKSILSALIAEVRFTLPSSLKTDRPFLEKLDLLDFPGARSREKFSEANIASVLPQVLRRGKVAYLFNKYSRSMQIGGVLFCHHNDQKSEATLGDTINSWIETNIGRTPEERADMLSNTDHVSPLFMVCTKFNKDLEHIKNDTKDNLDEHWKRFTKVLPEIIEPNTWMDQWVPKGKGFASEAFQSIYPLRDFYWSGHGSGKSCLFEGYDEKTGQGETVACAPSDFPDYMECLRNSFVNHEFVQRHFPNPSQTWREVATPGNDGSQPIIRDLGTISSCLSQARLQRYRTELHAIKDSMLSTLKAYHEPDDPTEKVSKVRMAVRGIRSLTPIVGGRQEIFGRIVDTMMVTVGDLRDIAYDVIIRKIETPKDFSKVASIRLAVPIDLNDSKAENARKLCNYFTCDPKELPTVLAGYGLTLDDILSEGQQILTTVAGVVTKHIHSHWVRHINACAKKLADILPNSDDVVRTLIDLCDKLKIRGILFEGIKSYCEKFSPDDQPNAIADFASLTLNNFVGDAGHSHMDDRTLQMISDKAKDCGVEVDTNVTRRPCPLDETLRALDEAAKTVNQGTIDVETLRKLPFFDNFLRWQNLMVAGLIYTSDVPHGDPKANAQLEKIMNECKGLY